MRPRDTECHSRRKGGKIPPETQLTPSHKMITTVGNGKKTEGPSGRKNTGEYAVKRSRTGNDNNRGRSDGRRMAAEIE